MSGKSTVESLRKSLKPFYDKQGSVYCKAIRDNVVFNNYGWKHLAYHSSGRKRNADDARMRLNLLSWVPEVIKHCKSAHNTNMYRQFFSGVEVEVMYFELAKIFPKRGKRNEVAIEVVVRKIGDNPPHYWTVRYFDKQKSPLI